MLESHGAEDELEIVSVADVPLSGEVILDPCSATRMGAAVDAVGALPQGRGGAILPDDLRVGTDEDVFPPPLQTLAVGGVDEFVVFPVISDPHDISP